MRLYPKPKTRYESFRLNPYAPLYNGLDLSFLKPGVYAQVNTGSGNSYISTGPRFCFFVKTTGLPRHVLLFPDIGRGGFNFGGHAINTPYTSVVNLVNQPCTLAVWASTTQSSPYIGICAVYKSGKAPYGIMIESHLGQFRVLLGDNVFENLGVINDGKWHALVAGSRGGGNGFYALDGNVTNVSSITDSSTNAINISWGTWGPGSYLYIGNSADLMYWQRALTEDEIKAFSDPENVDLRVGGIPLILPPRRRYWPVGIIPQSGIQTARKVPIHLFTATFVE